ncbi:MAG TPA: DNA methyltransferase [Candidatus Limnocylindrales bacterium]|nr:DNA methyltransferase [Candidatus Limnocylindrales bacterium]
MTAARSDREASATADSGASQLALDLPVELPRLQIEPDWKLQPRLWGHSFHPMCSYLASFPAALAHAFVARYSRPGDVVLDPFSGRGTAPLQAAAEGRIGVGNDLNPFAWCLTAAKLEPATPAEVATRITALRLAYRAVVRAWRSRAADVQATAGRAEPGSVPTEVAVAFHPRTFAEVLFLRETLRLDDRVDRHIAAAMTGILHGKSPAYLSTLMPNTFSMAPRYVREYAARTGYAAPERDTFALLEAKMRRLQRDPAPRGPGLALLGDARDAGARSRAALRTAGLPDRARLVVTSPPYLRVLRYGYYNWLRTWFLGLDGSAIDASLDAAHHRAPYLAFMREVLAGLRQALTDDAVVVLVIGEVATDRGHAVDGIGLADRVWEAAARPEGYRLAGVAVDEVDPNRKMTRLWGDEAGRATARDRILVLGATEAGRRRALAGAPLPVDWTWPPRLRSL